MAELANECAHTSEGKASVVDDNSAVVPITSLTDLKIIWDQNSWRIITKTKDLSSWCAKNELLKSERHRIDQFVLALSEELSAHRIETEKIEDHGHLKALLVPADIGPEGTTKEMALIKIMDIANRIIARHEQTGHFHMSKVTSYTNGGHNGNGDGKSSGPSF